MNVTPPDPALAKRMADAIRILSVDAIEAAKSGHPGAPMGMAEIAEVLWNRHLKHNPADPHWPDRDRFVLSNGHGSMLIYSLLHLTGYNLPADELRRFRSASRPVWRPPLGRSVRAWPMRSAWRCRKSCWPWNSTASTRASAWTSSITSPTCSWAMAA
jgi:hypothetical protein